ncbi:MAG: LysR substrate-binding domain-containing protein, partial [Pseudomonadota bacterium]|nr:LysR substrate-binding domain-containing protein [Pseudomonadota bacterium]
VARLGSMARAAESLHLTPQAISMQIKELESKVGMPLFDRVGRNVSLSTAGEYFLMHARRMQAALKDAENEMARLQQVESGLLTIGMVSTAKYFVPHLLARFHRERPGVDVRLQVLGNREQLVALMKDGEVDLAIMGRPPREMAARAEAFAAHPLVFVAPPDHPLLQVSQAPVSALASHPLIVREPGSGTRTAMETFFAEQRFEPRIAMEMSSNETIKQAVMAGLGLSFLSLHTVGLEMKTGLLKLLDIAGAPVMRTWHVVHLDARVLSPVAEAFRYFLIEEGQRYLREHHGSPTKLVA